MGCSFRPDWVAGFLRIRWQLCTGLGGRNHRNTHSGAAPARSSLAGCSSATKLGRPSRHMGGACSASGWAPTTWRLPPLGCWPWARPASSSPSGRGSGPGRRRPPARRRPRACRGAWRRPRQPPDESAEGTHMRDVPPQDAVPDAGRVGERRIPYAYGSCALTHAHHEPIQPCRCLTAL
jgi:hypothetical protein